MDYPRPLRTLYINSSGMLGTLTRLDPIDLAVALNDGRLPHLKHIQCTAKLGWDPLSDALGYIADELDERKGGIYMVINRCIIYSFCWDICLSTDHL